MTSLRNRTVMITGASSGIGEACARAFAVEGARLLLAARRVERLQSLADSLADGLDTEAHVIELDVRDASAVDAALAALPAEWAAVDVLVNNAGLGLGLGKLHEGVIEHWDRMIDTNVKGLLHVTRAFVPGMVERGRGHVINIGSIAGHELYPGGNVYCATKFAVDAITKGLRMDLVDTPIRVSTVDPGLVETEFSVVRFEGDVERAKRVYEGIEVLTGNDVADAVVYCASRPPHVQINEIIITPTNQASALVTSRRSG
ncbi:MAG: SDR family NAD(P)-dependent oxidoreductase [Blastocatellia bacterium]|nr:SDR family NAD(P)-dependent oxidoreductase [Blastocatellia bacterium]MBK6427399.1 SDR family NAD(P)-dependent oxidoreductase [Blastocatellia bacterium]